MTSAQATPQDTSIRYLKGVGPKRALILEKIGIHSVRDLLYYFPRRYEDRSVFRAIEEIRPGEYATVRGKVLSVSFKPLPRIKILEVLIGDQSGLIPAVWFNQPYLKNQFAEDQEIIIFGKAEVYQNRLQMVSPEFEFLEQDQEGIHTGRVTPIYPLTEGLFQRSLRTTIREIITGQTDRLLEDYLTDSFRRHHNLMELTQAIREMHFPTSLESQQNARRRVVFDEFFFFQMTLFKKVESMKSKYRAYSLGGATALVGEFQKLLPFAPTPSQTNAFRDIGENLSKTAPMNRLLMGDVGSGKTVIAAFAMLAAARDQHQAALLVPTEILADQHLQTLSRLLAPFDIPVASLTSSTPPARRDRIVAELACGKLKMVVGTHALLQDDIRFLKLALVIIDEQHKFGVYQRCQLLNSNPRPHQLVMTATPIPRTLALTLYGDLDVSTLRELPAGRQPIKTYWITRTKQGEILNHILEKLQQGEQAYFIFPLIDETEKLDLLAAKREYTRLSKTVFAGVRMGLVHGKLSAEERNETMKSFKKGEIAVLVATSVIEVGVDNPNATVMVIENTERFGLSQLHQMRGRIGRGTKPSECFLFGEPKTDEGKKRLRILTKSQDGFLIAEEDLKLRGPGDFWGARQSGDPMFRIADPVTDHEVFMLARQTGQEIYQQVPGASNYLDPQKFKICLEQLALRY